MARDPDDFYRTPPDAVMALATIKPRGGFDLDPCAGDGGLLAASAMVWGQAGLRMEGIEDHGGRVCRAQSLDWDVAAADGLSTSWEGRCVMVNPPFKDFQPWVEKAATEAKQAAVLLPLNAMASGERGAWWPAFAPTALVVLSVRPSFLPDGSTANADYAWYLWGIEAPPISWFKVQMARKERLALSQLSRRLKREDVTWD